MTRPTYVPAPTADDLDAQHTSLDVTCPHCGVERDAYCINQKTGRYLHNRVSHHQRITAARETT